MKKRHHEGHEDHEEGTMKPRITRMDTNLLETPFVVFFSISFV